MAPTSNKIHGTHIEQDKYGEKIPKIGYIDEKISGEGTEDIDSREIDKIQKRLDPDEQLLMAVRQSRVKPGGAAIITPNTMFVTNKRMLVRNPKKLGFAVDIEEYPYDTITNVKLTKGIFSSSIQITIPGMTEMSKVDRAFTIWGRDDTGVIDAIPKAKAEKMYEIIRAKVKEIKERKDAPSVVQQQQQQSPLDLLKTKFVNGEISAEEYEVKKKILEG